MKILNIAIIIVIMFGLIACKKKEVTEITPLKIEKEVTIDTDSIYFSSLASIEIYKDKFLFIEGHRNNRAIIMTDTNLNYLGAKLFKNRDFMFYGWIFNTYLDGDILYILDNTFHEIREYNLKTDELKKIPYEKGTNIYNDLYCIQSMNKIDNNNFVATNIGLNITGYKSDTNAILIGKLYDSKMKTKHNFRVKRNEFKYDEEFFNGKSSWGDEAYVSYNPKTKQIYFCFEHSSMVFVYNKNGEFENKKDLKMIRESNTMKVDSFLVRKKHNERALEFDDIGNIYKIVRDMKNKKKYIYRYDDDLEVTKIYNFPDSLSYSNYFRVYKNKFLIVNEGESKIIILTE